MYETYLQNEREFEEKFCYQSTGIVSGIKYGARVDDVKYDDIKSHNRLSLIKVMKALEKELEGEMKDMDMSVEFYAPLPSSPLN